MDSTSHQPPGSRTPPTLICVVSSAGGIRALEKLMEYLPGALPAAMVVVQHLHPGVKSRLSEILGWHTSIQVKGIADGDRLEQGVIYVATPGYHVMISEENRLVLSQEPKVRHARPSGDLLLDTAARHFKGRVIAIILTGRGSDGSVGVQAVHDSGGIIIVQDPESAQTRSMPDSAIETGVADHIISLEEIGHRLRSILEPGAMV